MPLRDSATGAKITQETLSEGENSTWYNLPERPYSVGPRRVERRHILDNAVTARLVDGLGLTIQELGNVKGVIWNAAINMHTHQSQGANKNDLNPGPGGHVRTCSDMDAFRMVDKSFQTGERVHLSAHRAAHFVKQSSVLLHPDFQESMAPEKYQVVLARYAKYMAQVYDGTTGLKLLDNRTFLAGVPQEVRASVQQTFGSRVAAPPEEALGGCTATPAAADAATAPSAASRAAALRTAAAPSAPTARSSAFGDQRAATAAAAATPAVAAAPHCAQPIVALTAADRAALAPLKAMAWGPPPQSACAPSAPSYCATSFSPSTPAARHFPSLASYTPAPAQLWPRSAPSYFCSAGPSAPSRSCSSYSSSSSVVHVSGYIRANGTSVEPYTRSAPSRK